MLYSGRSSVSHHLSSAAEVPTLPDFAYVKLREQILDGGLSAGAPLRQEKLAKSLGVSRLPIREALARLESDGLVVLRPRQGYVVASLDTAEIQEVFELRGVIEEYAGRLATPRRTQQDVADLEKILLAMEAILPDSSEDIVTFSMHNKAFHERLFAPSDRKLTCSLLSTLQDNSERFVRMGARLVSDLQFAHHEHRLIFDAFRDGNAELVGMHSRGHVLNTGSRLLSILNKNT
jgi:DNA-binding GntR family transcriptional regulator